MTIPPRLQKILANNSQLEGGVKLSISQFEPWIKHSTLPFFPEYTKHDIEHIEAVLATSSSLIRDQAWDALTAGDAAVLILATLLHDCAMHLSEDGFIALVTSPRSELHTIGLDDRPWRELWEDFLGEASRFDGRKLVQIFGSPEPPRRPPLDANKLTRSDRLLIGEFLRRHHARLAGEIAAFGVPTSGTAGLVLQGFSDSQDHIAGMAGLVARSHGSQVRALLPLLGSQFGLREFRGVHAVFLMTLLRVADYLQVSSERAPQQMLRVRALASPVSEGEWKAHHAIRDVQHTHDDPEAVFVDAIPPDVRTFLRLESWFHGIQRELDDSWAVLGEVYGRIDALRGLGLELRRIRSSIEDAAMFSQKVDYLPIEARFRAADADLLKLLIEPLYGHRPEVGLRELIQNAVDAVNELREFSSSLQLGHVDLPDQPADVLVDVDRADDGKCWVTVSDCGVGMTPEIVLEYFLTAGASFRRSEDWRKSFEDSQGKSKVLRAGRFGVGALASFLLGPQIEVSTRHFAHDAGIEFVASVDSDLLELRKVHRPVGTTIRVEISEHLSQRLSKEPDEQSYDPSRYHSASAHEALNWDWYCLSKPALLRQAAGKSLRARFSVPAAKEPNLPLGWERTYHPDFLDILWSYHEAPRLTVNGIRVEEPLRQGDRWSDRFGLKIPNLAVFDPDAKLPLDLQRTGLTVDRYPFDDVLARDVTLQLLAFALVKCPTKPPRTLDVTSWLRRLKYVGSGRAGTWRADSDWFLTRDGIGYVDPRLLLQTGCTSALVLRGPTGAFNKEPWPPPVGQALIAVVGDSGATSSDQWVRSVAEVAMQYEAPWRVGWDQHSIHVLQGVKPLGVRMLVSALVRDRIQNKLPKYVSREVITETVFGTWHLVRIGAPAESTFDFAGFVAKGVSADNDSISVTEVFFGEADPPSSPIGSLWVDAFGAALIPFDRDVRDVRFPGTHPLLRTHIARWKIRLKQDASQ